MYKFLLTLLAITVVLTTACHSAKIETPPVAAAVNQRTYKPGPGPTDAEVREAVLRNYEDAAVIDNSRPTPFIVGDFNGDHSEDIAIVVKPGKENSPSSTANTRTGFSKIHVSPFKSGSHHPNE